MSNSNNDRDYKQIQMDNSIPTTLPEACMKLEAIFASMGNYRVAT
jgi:hypothetical protein